MLKRLLTPFNFGLRSVLADALLVGNTFVWYYVALILLLQGVVPSNPSFELSLLIWGLHFGGLIISAIAGTFVSKKIEQRKLIILWVALGALSSLVAGLINHSDNLQVGLVGLLLGVSLGLGMPACISRYSDAIPSENRGRISGITLFASGIAIAVFSIIGINEILILGIILGLWRIFGLFVYLLPFKGSSRIKAANKSTIKYKKIFSQRPFIFYFIPWVMFSVINYLVAPASSAGGEANQGYYSLVQTGFMGLSALIGGFFIDSMGRKRIAVAGFILLGIGTAILGINSIEPIALYLNAIIDGIAWGFLLVLFILTIWGDLSYGTSTDKYYAIGVLPFFTSKLLDLTIGSQITSFFGGSPALFSFGAFFLFVAVLPLIYAPETLPEKALKDRDLKSYIEKAQKEAQKDGTKNQNNAKKAEEKSKDESPEDEKYAEACKLAEKYY
jgi:MFS family permease